MIRRFAFVALSAAAALTHSALAEDGVTADKILLGQSCALKGPAAALGSGMMLGLNVYFDRINAAGGVAGRKIELKSINDGYEPAQATLVSSTLIEKMKVFLLIGEVGTPTSKAVVPLCDKSKVPFVGPFTGAELLRNPFDRYVVNLRASYFQETEKLAEVLVDKKGLKKIACFYQNDAYGQAGLTGIQQALERRGLTLVSTGTYERNTLAVAKGLADVAAGSPDAVVMIGAYAPCAEFIKAARANEAMKAATLCNISFVGTEALLAAVGAAGDGIIVSQVVPYPWDISLPAVKEYQADMKAAGHEAEIGFVSLEGYLTARMFTQVLQKLDGEPTREAFLETVEKTGSFDLGGITLKFGPEDHQGLDDVFLTVFKDGKVQPLDI